MFCVLCFSCAIKLHFEKPRINKTQTDNKANCLKTFLFNLDL